MRLQQANLSSALQHPLILAAATPQRQQGMALVISLLLLVAITLLAISSMRNATLQERMAANLKDRELAKQVVEGTVRFAATQLPPAAGSAWFTATLPEPEEGEPNLWADPDAWDDAGVTEITINDVIYSGEFLVENMGSWVDRDNPACKVRDDPLCESQTYRITARTAEVEGRASVMLQAIWRM